MPENRQYEDDDGRVIADMSEVRRRNILIPTRIRHEERLQAPQEARKRNPWESDDVTPEQTRWAMFGALKAGLLIFLVYAVVFGLFILLLYVLIGNQMK